jgi:Reverse transcriptase (RNA-dependent DNA polymerase)
MICDNFNSFFINSIVEINNQILKNNDDTYNVNCPMYKSNNKFKFKETNVQNVCEIAKKLSKKSNKYEYLNAKVLYDAMEYIGYHLAFLINHSLKEGILPDSWKTSTVIPIPKIKNTKKSQEFRPINTIPPDAKIIENIVKKQLTEYVESNNILNKFQSAFRKGHSCETTLNNVFCCSCIS